MTRATWRRGASTVALCAAVAATGACGWRGLNSLPLPGTDGGGPDSYTVQVQMPDVGNLQPNSRVQVGDVSVGNVVKIERQGWHGLLTLRIDGDVALPTDTTAKIGQTSLLGSQHVELSPPADGGAPERLHDGDVIPLQRGGAYPTTEQTLAAVSLLLNGGGVGQIQDIVETFSTALRGREQELRSLIEQLDVFTTDLDEQTGEIIEAAEKFDRLVGVFAQQRPVVDRALAVLPTALTVLQHHRHDITEALDRLGRFSSTVENVVSATHEDLVKEVEAVAPLLRSLANAGPALTRSLGTLTTYPFPNETLDKWIRGDYGNYTLVLDLTLSRLDSALLTGTRWEGDLTLLELQWGRTIGQLPSPYTGGNPLLAPYHVDQGR